MVDDTVHFLSKYRKARHAFKYSPAKSIGYAFVAVGPELLNTTIALSVGFSILILSAFEPHAGLGLLTALAITLAFVTDFFLLPALLLAMDKI